MNFTKMQGAGNDFIVVETRDGKTDWSRLAVAMCDRHFGVGADGLLLVMPSQTADIRMRLFNADGSEAEMCGNGIRCLGRYVFDRGLARSGEVRVETLAGTRTVRLAADDGKPVGIRVGMGRPEFAAQRIPVAIRSLDITPILDHAVSVGRDKLSLSFVSMGNPHAVLFSDRPVADFPLTRLGPRVEHHRLFPNRTNFEVGRVIDRRHIEARVWERGCGETLACGTGACAVGVAARLHGYTSNVVDITLRGGTLTVEWDGAGEVFLSGPAGTVFTGQWAREVQSR